MPFLFRYACRDFWRGAASVVACLVFGTALLAGVLSLSDGLSESLRAGGRAILGGDVALRTEGAPASKEQIAFLRKQGPVTIVMETRSVAKFNSRETPIELKAVDPFYPIYGEIKVLNAPKVALQDLIVPPAGSDNWGALVEEDLLATLHAKIGDKIIIDGRSFELRGIVASEPDRLSNLRFRIAPRVLTGLYAVKNGNASYDHKLYLPHIRSFAALKEKEKEIATAFPGGKWQGRDYFDAAPEARRALEKLSIVLNLAGVAALILAGFGISIGCRAYFEARLNDIATLKSLGGDRRLILNIALLQTLFISLIGILGGLLLGGSAAALICLKAARALDIPPFVTLFPGALVQAAGAALLTAFAFAAVPLLKATRISPAALFRGASLQAKKPRIARALFLGITLMVAVLHAQTGLSSLVSTSVSDAAASMNVAAALKRANALVDGIAEAGLSVALLLFISGLFTLAAIVAAERRRHLYEATVLKTLGMTRRQIMRLFLKEYGMAGLKTALAALAAGLVLGLGAQKLLSGTVQFDPRALIVAILCLGVTLLAGSLAGRRALSKRPAAALKEY